MITPIGSLTIGVAVPGGAAGVVAGQTGIGLALPDIQARLDALAAFAPVTQNYLAMIAQAQAIIASIQAMILAGISPPSLSAQIAIVAALVVDLEAAVVAINAQLTILVNLATLFATAGVSVYAFDGANNAFGGELTTALGGATTHTNALVLATTSGATWTAMSAIFKVTP